jgi:plastocyanin
MYTRKIAVVVVVVVVASIFFGSLVVTSLSVLAQEASPSLVKDVSIVPNASTLGDKAFSPNPVEVKVGGGVTWSNDDSQIHTVTSGISPAAVPAGSNETSGPDGVFDSGILSPGATFDFVFDTPGTYSYYCTLHPQMVGTVTVS